ncbi:MAG: aminodeoxychorismate/anthranilate synthase component II [Candidatus Omnitrophica bacterium]|nr:aminodeoxychorismate/anthranilate synthase component II [Candidatus Omnitrophota bacterium]
MNKLLVIDNYDSFTFNVVHYLEEMGAKTVVVRNDKIDCKKIKKMKPFGIVISPGPCTPLEAGISNDVIREFSGKIPILGVCLGHQCIGHVFGGDVVRARRIVHGKTSLIHHNKKGIFAGIATPFAATRYHSLLVKDSTLPGVLNVTATTDKGEIMALQHISHPTFGVQFHPESIKTDHGHTLLGNFIKIAKKFRR